MKKVVAIVLLLVFSWNMLIAESAAQPTSSQSPEDDVAYEYVFTEAELRAFLQENIREAVDKTTAVLVRDHEIEKVMWNQQLEEKDGVIAGLNTELSAAGFKLAFRVTAAAALGLGIGYIAGKLF